MNKLSEIKSVRRSLGITQSKLARLSGVSQSFIARIESGKVDPAYSKVEKIFDALEKINKPREITAKDLMKKKVISISSKDRISKAIQLMKKYNISQLPVIDSLVPVGSIKESTVIKNLDKDISEKRVEDIMEDSFPVIDSNDTIKTTRSLLDFHQAVLFTEKGKIVGIMTKTDLLGLIK